MDGQKKRLQGKMHHHRDRLVCMYKPGGKS